MPRQTRPHWWLYVKRIIQDYPRLKKDIETPLETNMAVSYDGMPKGKGGISRPVENAVIHGLNPKDQRKFDAVDEAIRRTKEKQNGEDILRVIDMVYFQRTHTIAGAALKIPISENQAGRWNGEFIRLVAEILDLP